MKTLLPVLTVLLLVACGGSEESRYKRDCLRNGKKLVEPRLKKTEVDDESLTPHLQSLLVTNESILGVWENRDRLGCFVSLSIEEKKGGNLDVLFHTSGCVNRWSLKRTATFQGGVLQLNKPVEEYSSMPYTHLYMIQTTNGIRLASQQLARELIRGEALDEWKRDEQIVFSHFLIHKNDID